MNTSEAFEIIRSIKKSERFSRKDIDYDIIKRTERTLKIHGTISEGSFRYLNSIYKRICGGLNG